MTRHSVRVVLGLDLGTTYFKCVVMSQTGDLIGVGRTAVDADQPEANYRELPVWRFSELVITVARNALTAAGCTASDVASVSYSSQANSFALFRGDVAPLTPIVLWTDERSAGFEHERIDSRAMPAKLLWFQANEPAVWQKTEHILTISEILVFLLTGEICGDAATAVLTGLAESDGLEYDTDCIRSFNLTRSMLSTTTLPGTRIAYTSGKLAIKLGLRPDTMLTAGNLDHVSAAIGAGIGSVAPASISIGTVLAITDLLSTDETTTYEQEEGCITGPYLDRNRRFRIRFREMGASTLEWYKNKYAPEKTFDELVEDAARVPPGCDGVRVRPHVAHSIRDRQSVFWRHQGFPDAFGDGYFVRAIMEATAVTLGALFDAVFTGSSPRSVVTTGGGSRSNLWLQIVADITGVTVLRVDIEEPAAYGAAMLAAVGTGWYEDIDSFGKAHSYNAVVFAPQTNRYQACEDLKEFVHE